MNPLLDNASQSLYSVAGPLKLEAINYYIFILESWQTLLQTVYEKKTVLYN